MQITNNFKGEPFVLNRRNFLKATGLCLLPLLPNAAAAPGSKRTNIIFIMIDDLGWMDLHCQGNKRLDTPNIDRLAKQGMRFTDAYAAAPVCSPTRAANMTGISPARLGLTTHIPDRVSFAPKDAPLRSAETLDYLPLNHVTIAERLKDAGYATAFLGKWHLSGKSGAGGKGEQQYEPQWQGFDINIGGCSYGGPPTYFDPYRIYNIPPRKKGEYLPDRLGDEAAKFIRSSRDKPFFLALWNYTVHWPMEAPEDLVEKYKTRKGPGIKDPRYAAMIEALDSSMGRLFELLDELELADNTLLIFTSDNGGFSGVADNRPLRDGKGTLYEGGIRVPLIVRWPGKISADTTCNVPVISTDFYPTILNAANLKPAPDIILDGENIMPLLTGRGRLIRKSIYFHYPNYAWHGSNKLGGAIRQGNYKLIERYQDNSVELYNLKDDLSEKNDLAAQMPKKAANMKTQLDAWLKHTNAKMPTKINKDKQ